MHYILLNRLHSSFFVTGDEKLALPFFFSQFSKAFFPSILRRGLAKDGIRPEVVKPFLVRGQLYFLGSSNPIKVVIRAPEGVSPMGVGMGWNPASRLESSQKFSNTSPPKLYNKAFRALLYISQPNQTGDPRIRRVSPMVVWLRAATTASPSCASASSPPSWRSPGHRTGLNPQDSFMVRGIHCARIPTPKHISKSFL